MMAIHWYPDRRQRFERALLDHYHVALLEHGVHGYDRAALDDDYRLATLVQIATPVWQVGGDEFARLRLRNRTERRASGRADRRKACMWIRRGRPGTLTS
jgi:hypothetical protein